MTRQLLLSAALISGFFCSAQPFSCVPSITPEDWVDSDSFIRPFGLAMKYPQCAPAADLSLVGWNAASGDLQVMPSFNTKFAAKFNGTTSQYVRGDGSFATFPSTASRVVNNNVSRSLNSNYTISSTRDCTVTYSVALSVTNPLLAGSSTANAFLEYSTDGGTTWTTVSHVSNQSSVALTVTVAITLPNTFVLSGYVPANALTRIRSTTTGTASVTYTRGQEIYL